MSFYKEERVEYPCLPHDLPSMSYCKKDHCLLCRTCLTKHKNHEIISIERAAWFERDMLQSSYKILDKLNEKSLEKIGYIIEELEKVTNLENSNEKSIGTMFDLIRERIDIYESEIKKILSEKFSKTKANYTALLTNLKSNTEEIQHLKTNEYVTDDLILLNASDRFQKIKKFYEDFSEKVEFKDLHTLKIDNNRLAEAITKRMKIELLSVDIWKNREKKVGFKQFIDEIFRSKDLLLLATNIFNVEDRVCSPARDSLKLGLE